MVGGGEGKQDAQLCRMGGGGGDTVKNRADVDPQNVLKIKKNSKERYRKKKKKKNGSWGGDAGEKERKGKRVREKNHILAERLPGGVSSKACC